MRVSQRLALDLWGAIGDFAGFVVSLQVCLPVAVSGATVADHACSLMGWSAFVGFAILVVAVPLNYSLGKQSIQVRITRELLSISDLRCRSRELVQRRAMHVKLRSRSSSHVRLFFSFWKSESNRWRFTAIRTIKFFGWSDAWIEKTQAKRSTELHWVVQGEFLPNLPTLLLTSVTEWLNRFYLTVLWALISLVVPLASFFFFVKIQQKELTVAIAFTVRSLQCSLPAALTGSLRHSHSFPWSVDPSISARRSSPSSSKRC